MRSLCVAVPVGEGEEVRRSLAERGLLRKTLRIERDGDRLLLPVTADPGLDYPTLERDFSEGFRAVRSYRDFLRLPRELDALLPRAFDSIGDIVILRIPRELRAHEGAIGDAILRWNPKARVVAADEGVEGELRVRRVRVVAGERRTRTVHVEYGLRYAVDVERAYFSPRLGTERWRVASQVRPGETVVDMFAGVGPYAVLIATRRRPRVVHAIDANPGAVALLEENVRVNRADRVVVHGGRGEEVLRELGLVDRVVMDFPTGAGAFLPQGVASLRPGGTVHFYAIAERDLLEAAKSEALARASESGRRVRVAGLREVRGYSPGKVEVAIDLVVTGGGPRAGPASGRTARRTPSPRAPSVPRRRSARTAPRRRRRRARAPR